MLGDLLQDIYFTARMIRKNKVFSALVVFVLAVGIGATTGAFSLLERVVLKPLPFRDPAKLLVVWDTYLPQFSKVGVSPADLQAWQAQRSLFEETAWYRYVPLDGSLALPAAESMAVHAGFVSTNLFSFLGTSTPLLGRAFMDKEDPHSVLLSEHVWRSRFSSDSHVVGTLVRFNEEPFTVVGVMPAAAQFPDWADIWLPRGPLLADELTNPVRHALGFLARRRSGVTEEQAAARLTAISRRLAGEHPKTSVGWGIRLTGLQEDLTGNVRPTLVLIFSAAAFLLLVACANIASLLLSRAAGRVKEMAIRAAVGASTLRILRQLLTESVALALAGGTLGWLFAAAGLMAAVPRQTHFDLTIALFLVGISLATGGFFGTAPAWQVLRIDPQSAIKTGSVTSSGMTARSILVVFEFALTLMLVIGAGILTRSFVNLMRVDPGFDPKGVVTTRILAPPSRDANQLFHRMQERLLSLPGVQTIAATNALPLVADRANTARFSVPGSPLMRANALPAAQVRTASPDYFRAMRISVKAGRAFTERDLNQPVVIINETMAKRFWPGREAVGIKFVTGPWGPNPTWSTIVGVVSDVKQFGLDSEPTFDIYYPHLGGQYLIVKMSGGAVALTSSLPAAVHAADPALAISDTKSLADIAAESARTRRWTMDVLAAFAMLAFLLALVGIYGVLSWSVAQRTREVGIRMALGAQKRQVLVLVLRQGLKLALTGLGLGILASLALRHLLSSLVYGVSTSDPVVYTVVPALMFAAALLACYFPARQATSADPLLSLRYE